MGDNLYWMITITDRNQSQKFLSFYKTYGIEVVFSTLGKGTAASEILNDFGPCANTRSTAAHSTRCPF